MLDSSTEDLPVKNKQVDYKIFSISRVHASISKYLYPYFKSYKDIPINFGSISKYKIGRIIGYGKFSTVFIGTDGTRKVAIKVFKEVKQVTISREICILQYAKKLEGIVQLYDVIKDPKCGYIALVLEYHKTYSSKTMFDNFNLEKLRDFLYKLFTGLYNLHSHGIMHRDIKPGNLLFDKNTGDLLISDLGLAELYYPWKQYSTGIGTLRWMAPELILDYRFYDYAVDIWAVGIIIFEITIRAPIFKGETLFDILKNQAKLLTPSAILEYSEKYGIFIPSGVLMALPQYNFDRWPEYLKEMKPEYKDNDLIDLMKRCLTCDHQKRITARDALDHPFFEPIKQAKKNKIKKSSSTKLIPP